MILFRFLPFFFLGGLAGSRRSFLIVDRVFVAAAHDGFVGGEVFRLVLSLDIAGLSFADEFPKSDGLGVIAAPLVKASQHAVQGRVVRLFLTGLLQYTYGMV